MSVYDNEIDLSRLSDDYVSVYRIELNSGKYEILKLDDNTNASRLVGRERKIYADYDEYAKEYADAFIAEEDRAEFIDNISCKNMKDRLMKTEKITFHYQSNGKDGRKRYYEANAIKDAVDEENFNIILRFRNVDAILYKERAIQNQLKMALEEARLGNEIVSAIAKTYQYISRIDIDGDYFEEISNRDTNNMGFIKCGRLSVNNEQVYKKVVAEEYQEAFLKFSDISTLPERMKNEETIVMEYRMKDGNWHKLRFIEKKRDENGRLTHVICAIRSISDDKKRENELIHQVAEAKKDAAAKTRFLSNMSHDIRTPVNGIIGMLEMANRHPEDLELQANCRAGIMKSSKYLVTLVNDILDMNKLESDSEPEGNINFDLTEILSRANSSKQMEATDKNIEYMVNWDWSVINHIYLEGNPVYLERMLTIVSDNAIKFTNSGGFIRVWCAEKSSDSESVVYEFGCTDNGIGMSPEFVEHAFDMFSQENITSRTRYEGSGLGLAIAKKLAEKMGGTIRLESRKGVGTKVVMTIPFKIGRVIEKNQKNIPENISLEGLRVLVAEDNELNMEIATFMLENHGMIVEGVSNGLEAVQKFEKSEQGYYDVIFMDIMMPVLNGWDATRKIRALKRNDAATVPIIAMSANALMEDIVNSRISGMNSHLAKPLDDVHIVEAMKECIL